MARLIEVDEIPQGKTFKLVPVEPDDTGKQVDKGIADIPRQLGLTGRHIIEGAADMVGTFSDPIAALLNFGGAKAQSANDVGKYVADTIGLPSPQNAVERGVGDASRLLVGSGGMIGAANKAAGATRGATQKVLETIAANPAMQATSAVGAGGGGSYMRETGGGTGAQLLGAVAGGVAAPLAVGGTVKAANAVGNYFKNQGQNVEVVIDNAIKQAGIPLERIPASVQAQIRSDVGEALKIGGNLSPDAIRRLADYRLVGATPRRGNLTLSPVDLTQDKNLAKMGANSTDPVAQQLAMTENQNDRTLLSRLNDLGANTADDQYSGASKIIGSLTAKKDAAKKVIDAAYQGARGTEGRSVPLDHLAFTNRANDLLDNNMVGGQLPADVRNLLNKVATGDMPLTVDVAEQFKTRIGNLQRNTTDKTVKLALGYVRQALDEAPLLDGAGQQAVDAFSKARTLNRQWMSVVERTPALQAVVEGTTPDNFVKDFIVGSGTNKNVMDLARLKRVLNSDKEAVSAVKGQIALYLKNQATGGNADEVANFSAANFNKALQQMGDRKLSLFFTKDEVEQLKAIGRVAKYEKFQPTGSAVNNSNTASTLFMAFVDKLANSPLVRKIPFGSELVSNPAQNVAVSIKSGRSLNAPGALTTPTPKQPMALPVWPLMAGGLLTE